MEDRIRLTIADGIADVRLNRADKMNALDPAMFRAIAEAGARLKDDRSLRAVVLSGEGSAFCAGLDVERVAAMAAGSSILPLDDTGAPAGQLPSEIQTSSHLPSGLDFCTIREANGVM